MSTTGTLAASSSVATPLRVVQEMATPDDSPGSGVAWNEDAVRRFAA